MLNRMLSNRRRGKFLRDLEDFADEIVRHIPEEILNGDCKITISAEDGVTHTQIEGGPITVLANLVMVTKNVERHSGLVGMSKHLYNCLEEKIIEGE